MTNINTDVVLLASAVRTATNSTPDQKNNLGKGAYVILDITAVPGAQSVTLTVEAKDPTSGKYVTIFSGAALTTTGTRTYLVHPDAGTAADGVTATRAFPLPKTWRVTITHSGGGNFTYSVGAAMVL